MGLPVLAWAGLVVPSGRAASRAPLAPVGVRLWVSGRVKWQMEKRVCVQLGQDEMKTNWKKRLSELRVSQVL